MVGEQKVAASCLRYRTSHLVNLSSGLRDPGPASTRPLVSVSSYLHVDKRSVKQVFAQFQCLEKVPTKTFSLIKAQTMAFTIRIN